MNRVLAAKTAILFKLQFVRSILFILGGRVVALLALSAGKSHDIAHHSILGARPVGQGACSC
jgi:hypothetical protein